MTSVVVCGYYGFGNTGDEAMLRATLQGLGRRLDDVGFTVISGHPREVHREHGVAAVGRLDAGGIARAMGKADLFLSGGGSLLQDATSWRNLVYHLSLFALARRSGARSMIYAQGVGPIRTRVGRAMAPWALRGVAAITVRDPASAAQLRALGVEDPPAEVTADPAFALEPCPAGRVEELLRRERLAGGGAPLIGIAPRGIRHREVEAEALAFLADWAIRRLKVRPLLVPMQYPHDLAACDMIARRVRQTGEVAMPRRPLAPEEVLGLLGRCEVVVGVRLHALIFAAAMGVPVVGVEYDPKVAYFLGRLGLQPAVTMDTLSAAREDLVLGLERAWAERAATRRRLAEVVPEFKRLAERNFEVAAAVARGGRRSP